MTTPFLYQGLAVMTTTQLAEAYGVTPSALQVNFSRNKVSYVEGTDFLLLAGDELREFKRNFIACKVAGNVGRLYLWTEGGAYLHAKSLNTDTAWRAYRAWAAKSDGREQIEQGEESGMNEMQTLNLERDCIHMSNLVFIENDRVVTDSLTVAEVFGKRHDSVLRDIDVQIAKLKEVEEEKFTLHNFVEGRYVHPKNKQQHRKFLLTEDAFALVVMAYVTPEAMRFKVRFINEFNRMKEELSRRTTHSQMPSSIEDLIIMQAQSVKELKNQVATIQTEQAQLRSQQAQQETKVERMTTALTATPDRKQFQRKINEYARLAKMSVAEAKNDAFAILEDKQGIALKTRVNNRWKKINDERAAEGKKPLGRDSLQKKYNRMDVIEELDLLGELMQIVAGLIGTVAGQAEVATGEYVEMNVDDNPLVKLTELCVNLSMVTMADVQEASKLLSECAANEQSDGYNMFKAILYKFENQPAY